MGCMLCFNPPSRFKRVKIIFCVNEQYALMDIYYYYYLTWNFYIYKAGYHIFNLNFLL